MACLSHDQGEPDTREETCMESQTYILIKMCEKCMYYIHTQHANIFLLSSILIWTKYCGTSTKFLKN